MSPTATAGIKVNARIQAVAESLTLKLTANAKAMKAEGIDVVGFGAGEPDFPTPELIRRQARDDIEAGITRYTPASGTLELRRAICEKLRRHNGLDYEPGQVVVSCGGKHSLYNIFMTMLEEGDEVLLPAPYWLSYPEQIAMGGGVARVLETSASTGYKITAEQLAAAISPRTVAFLFNSPSNPTGMVYTPDEIRALAEALDPHPRIAVISDEIYEHLLYGGMEHLSFAAASPAIKERTLTVNSMSKTYAMTGWRIGYCAGPAEFIGAVGRFQSHSTSGPTSFCQSASIAALQEGDPDVQRMRVAFDERRQVMVGRLREIPGIECPEPLGAFYCFPRIAALYEKAGVGGSLEFCERLLAEVRIACVPGLPFGADGSMRLSYALGLEDINKGLDRLAEFVSGLG